MNIAATEAVQADTIFAIFMNADPVAIAAVAIASIVAFVEIKNYFIARDQIRHDLFERRFEVQKEVRVFLSNIMQHGNLEYDTLPDFYNAMQKSHFLFGNDINEFLQEVKDRAFKLSKAHLRLRERNDDEGNRLRAVEDASREIEWLTDELTHLHKRFGPYMNFDRR